MEMSDVSRLQSNDSVDKSGKRFGENITNLTHGSSTRPRARERRQDGPSQPSGVEYHGQTYSHSHFKVYRRRWFGLGQLVLLNIVVSWDVCLALYFTTDCVEVRWKTRSHS
jgi:FLVCR family MFS transporter 7